MSESKPRVAVVVPCFNEEVRFNKEYWTGIIDLFQTINWVFVDDGSTDNTYQVLKALPSQSNVSVLREQKNAGKAEAIRLGMNQLLNGNLNLDLIAYIDSDGAFSSNDIQSLLDVAVGDFIKSEVKDAWISSRVRLAGRSIQRRKTRHYLGRLIATLVTFGWEKAPYDTQSGFKIFLITEQLRKALTTSLRTRWFFDVEILNRIAMGKRAPSSIWEEPLSSWKDISGSHIGPRQYFQILKDLIIARQGVRKVIEIEHEVKNGFN